MFQFKVNKMSVYIRVSGSSLGNAGWWRCVQCSDVWVMKSAERRVAILLAIGHKVGFHVPIWWKLDPSGAFWILAIMFASECYNRAGALALTHSTVLSVAEVSCIHSSSNITSEDKKLPRKSHHGSAWMPGKWHWLSLHDSGSGIWAGREDFVSPHGQETPHRSAHLCHAHGDICLVCTGRWSSRRWR